MPAVGDEAEFISIPARMRRLAAERPDGVVWRFIAADGPEITFTWPELERRSGQLAGALAERGLGVGDRLGIGLRNSPQFVLAVLAAWKLGAIPVPMRWDLPDWELDRLREAIDGKVHLGEDDLAWIDATAEREVPDLPDVVSPQVQRHLQQRVDRTAQGHRQQPPGGVDPALTIPIAEGWRRIPRPQVVLVLGPMYHMNGFHSCVSLSAATTWWSWSGSTPPKSST